MKTLSRNMIMSVCSRIVAMVCGMVVQRYILISYGSTYNGLTASIAQVMSYLALLEAGLGAASIQALYSPIAGNDWKSVSGIFVATRNTYRRISIIFLGLLLLVSIILPMIVANEVEYALAALLTFITGASSVIAYVIGGKYSSLLSADRRVYVLHVNDIITIVLSCILRIIALRNGHGIVFVQTINLLTVGLKNVFCCVYARCKYCNLDVRAKPNYVAISKRWNVLVHSIAGMVVNHTDITILTVAASLKLVSVYSVYNMVFSQLSLVISSTFVQAPQATFGKLYNQSEKRFRKLYDVYETLFLILLFILCTITITLVLPFVQIYTSGITDVDYIDKWLPILFGVIMLLNHIRVPSLIMVNVSGRFKETQKGAIIESIINIVVSLVLFFCFNMGIHGLLIGTIASYLYRTIDLMSYSYKYIVRKHIGGLTRLLLINGVTLVLLYVIFEKICVYEISSFGAWMGYAIVISSITVVIFVFINLLFNRAIVSKVKEIIQ